MQPLTCLKSFNADHFSNWIRLSKLKSDFQQIRSLKGVDPSIESQN